MDTYQNLPIYKEALDRDAHWDALLFALFIKPLAISIITGIKSKSAHHKISLYADDIWLYLTKLTSPSLLLVVYISVCNSYTEKLH